MAILTKSKRQSALNIARPALVLILVLALGYLLGFSNGYIISHGFNNLAGNGNLSLQSPNFQLFWTVADLINKKYIGAIKPTDLLYGSVSGLVAALNDSYSSFELPGQSTALTEELSGNYEGIGVELEYRDQNIVVVAPIKGSSAEAMGVRAGDVVVKIDGVDVSALDLPTVIDKIRGPIGSKVTLTLERSGKMIDFQLIRTLIHIKSVSLREEDNLAVVSISKFVDDTTGLFDKIVPEIVAHNDKAVILDLRNNPGGLFDAAVKVANEFLPSGQKIVEERFKDNQKTAFSSDGSGRLTNIKLIVLINGGTASAAEIVAGALKDNKRATLVGEKTFGKGSVQEVDQFADGSLLKLTIAKWFSPGGYSIDNGIQPDLAVSDQEAQDLVLLKAKELAKQ
jgi:carboxyl-terminal processing protease